MSYSGSNIANVGPPQNLATAPIAIAGPGPNGETQGNALVVVGAIPLDTSGLATTANQLAEIALLPGFPTGASQIPSAAATTNGTVAKASAGKLFGAYGWNANAALRYLKIYNKATAPTVGSDTPILTLPLPPTAAFAFDFAGFNFAAGIAYAMTTGVAVADTGALSAADVLALNVVYS